MTSNNSKPASIPLVSTSIGAVVDSFYRSAMNSWLNASLTNKRSALFPNMHIQTPFRVVYMNGIKNIRLYLDSKKSSLIEDGYNKNMVRFGTAIAPGLIMTPFSSVLEASNAGHMNPEPIATRWMRGLTPRAVREVIFAVGLNQVSDTCQASVPATITDPYARNIIGSISAGVLAGYFSHVPHNLSSLKLLKPQVSYNDHFNSLLKSSMSRFKFSESSRLVGISTMIVFPRGVLIRTAQIVGTFVIINGAIALLADKDLDSKLLSYGRRTAVAS